MPVPERLWRFPIAAAIESLARRFGLPSGSQVQDWPWEVADPGERTPSRALDEGS